MKADPADPHSLTVALKEPVVGNKAGDATGLADVRYDGQGGLTGEDGRAVGAFWSSGPNRSTYELRTRWADEVGPGNALPEYPRPQLTRDNWQKSGEYGGLGLAVPGHAWAVQQSYIAVDPATYTDDHLARLDEVRKIACRGSNGAVYTRISDVEGELNGPTTGGSSSPR